MSWAELAVRRSCGENSAGIDFCSEGLVDHPYCSRKSRSSICVPGPEHCIEVGGLVRRQDRADGPDSLLSVAGPSNDGGTVGRKVKACVVYVLTGQASVQELAKNKAVNRRPCIGCIRHAYLRHCRATAGLGCLISYASKLFVFGNALLIMACYW